MSRQSSSIKIEGYFPIALEGIPKQRNPEKQRQAFKYKKKIVEIAS